MLSPHTWLTREPGGTEIVDVNSRAFTVCAASPRMTPQSGVCCCLKRSESVSPRKDQTRARAGPLRSFRSLLPIRPPYQGVARRFDRQIVEQFNAFAIGDCRPDAPSCSILITASRFAMRRTARRPDRWNWGEDDVIYDHSRNPIGLPRANRIALS